MSFWCWDVQIHGHVHSVFCDIYFYLYPSNEFRIFQLIFIALSLVIELRMEIENVSKRQQPDQRVEKCRRPPMGLQHSEKIPHSEKCLSWPLNKNVY